MNALEIRHLTLHVGEKCVLNDFSLSIPKGEIHVLMGKNGRGKSSLAKAIVGYPDYHVTGGEIVFNGENMVQLPPEERAQRGIFLAHQNPVAIPGVSVSTFIRAAMNAQQKKMTTVAFYELLHGHMDRLGLRREFSARAINDGFSGGEKKRCEVLQMLMLRPSFAILDEIDSGLDIDALKIVAENIKSLYSSDFSALVITHYQRLLDHIAPHKVHILEDGKITLSGGPEIVQELEKKGYAFLFDREELAPE
ncbi:MAG: Fe-S cluster assembly ATPase SufC [Puniceicoccales bacterium]|jgi:Fe-S cluster assembly ATP-binding protein|nr:Fe-S cluster assembly ATPase SufC [Puniceicoccales bacterium]